MTPVPHFHVTMVNERAFLNVYFNVPFYLGGTSLLIAVVVTMDFMAQVQSHLMSQQYDSLMKKANLKKVGRK